MTAVEKTIAANSKNLQALAKVRCQEYRQAMTGLEKNIDWAVFPPTSDKQGLLEDRSRYVPDLNTDPVNDRKGDLIRPWLENVD